MLSAHILQALNNYTATMQKTVRLILQSGEHEKKSELVEFIKDICRVSDKIQWEEKDMQGLLRSPISFMLTIDEQDTGIRFSGIPSGHEFNSLILAILQASGTPLKLDVGLQQLIANNKEALHFEVFVSLTCHNCPDVVQALNQFALLNSRISVEMIDGGLFQELIQQRNIQGVPTVYLNGELFAHGKVTAVELIDKMVARYPSLQQAIVAVTLPVQDVTVIGGGPAGVSAAIYAARKGLKVTLITDHIGGQVKDTFGIENLISVPHTTGSALSGALQAHLQAYDIRVKEMIKVTHVDNAPIKTLTLSSGEKIQSKTLIIATGAKWRELGIPGEKENIGNGVAYCPHCDGPFFKGKRVAVIGGGNSGIEAALDLAGIVQSVTVFEFMSELKADQILISQAQARDNITLYKNVATQSIQATYGKVSGIEYVDRATEQVHHLPLEGVFVQIGLVPNSNFLAGIVERTRSGEIVINEKCQTSAEGIYACGDVSTVPYKQIVIAMGEGAKAALSAFEFVLRG